MKAKQIQDAGTAITKNIGTSPENVIQLLANNKIPELDGSQLTGISGGGSSDPALLTVNTPTISSNSYQIPDTINNSEVFYLDVGGNGASVDLYLPSASAVGAGSFIHIARTATGSSGYLLNVYPKQNSSDTLPYYLTTPQLSRDDAMTLVSDGTSSWIIIGHHNN